MSGYTDIYSDIYEADPSVAPIPVLPSLPAGYIATADDFNDLAYACTFLLTKPIAHLTDSAGSQAIGTSASSLSFAQNDIDTSGMYSSDSPTKLTVQIPGRYKVRFSVFGLGSTNPIQSYMRSTTGANNPQGSGVTHTFWGAYSAPFTGNGGGAGGGGVWPDYMYEGDYWEVRMEATLGTGNSTQAGTSFVSVEYVGIS